MYQFAFLWKLILSRSARMQACVASDRARRKGFASEMLSSLYLGDSFYFIKRH